MTIIRIKTSMYHVHCDDDDYDLDTAMEPLLDGGGDLSVELTVDAEMRITSARFIPRECSKCTSPAPNGPSPCPLNSEIHGDYTPCVCCEGCRAACGDEI